MKMNKVAWISLAIGIAYLIAVILMVLGIIRRSDNLNLVAVILFLTGAFVSLANVFISRRK